MRVCKYMGTCGVDNCQLTVSTCKLRLKMVRGERASLIDDRELEEGDIFIRDYANSRGKKLAYVRMLVDKEHLPYRMIHMKSNLMGVINEETREALDVLLDEADVRLSKKQEEKQLKNIDVLKTEHPLITDERCFKLSWFPNVESLNKWWLRFLSEEDD